MGYRTTREANQRINFNFRPPGEREGALWDVAKERAERDEQLRAEWAQVEHQLASLQWDSDVGEVARLIARDAALRLLSPLATAARDAAEDSFTKQRESGSQPRFLTGKEKLTNSINAQIAKTRAALNEHLNPAQVNPHLYSGKPRRQPMSEFQHEQRQRQRQLEDEIALLELQLTGLPDAEITRRTKINAVRALDREIEFFASGRSGDSNRHERLSRLKPERRNLLQRYGLTESDILEPATPDAGETNEGDELNAT